MGKGRTAICLQSIVCLMLESGEKPRVQLLILNFLNIEVKGHLLAYILVKLFPFLKSLILLLLFQCLQSRKNHMRTMQLSCSIATTAHFLFARLNWCFRNLCCSRLGCIRNVLELFCSLQSSQAGPGGYKNPLRVAKGTLHAQQTFRTCSWQQQLCIFVDLEEPENCTSNLTYAVLSPVLYSHFHKISLYMQKLHSF